jgi:RNA 2',3'-cyclic 3'-phosphodiesterase
MRLFVAVTPPPEALDELEAAVAPLRSSCRDLRWTGRQNWHVTLAFLGEVDGAAVDKLAPALTDVAAHAEARPVSLGPAGSFPEGRPLANVLWVGLDEGADFVRDLAKDVREAAADAGVPPVGKPKAYHPHLTLGRCRNPADLRSLLCRLGGFRGRPWLAGEIQLFRSHLRPQWPEPRYEDLGRWPLAAGAGVAGPAPPAA